MKKERHDQRLVRFEATLRARGLRVTIQRRAVFEAVLKHKNHPTADRVYDQIRKRFPGTSRTSVYRILDTFVELGLINRICHHSSSARYDAKTYRHHHLVCSYCETIIDVEDELPMKVKLPNAGAYGFEIDDYYVHFHGVCSSCRPRIRKGGIPACSTAAEGSARQWASKGTRIRKKRSREL